MITGDDVSVVVQGPVHGRPSDSPSQQLTRRALASARTVWPGCELILSTWKGSDVTNLGFDRLVENEDPGAISFNDAGQSRRFNNLNRQLVSTRAGLAQATRRFAIKLRSDCVLEHAVDFELIENAPRDPRWSLLEKPVIALNLYTRHPLRRPVLFHVSDLFHAGLLSDLRTLWSTPLVEEPGFTRAIDPQHRPIIDAYPQHGFLMRCSPEQYLGEQLSRQKAPSLRLSHHSDGDIGRLFLWLRILANNFRLVTPQGAGIRLPAHLAGSEVSPDLFQPDEREWLECWTRRHVPLSLRLRSAIEFRLAQLAYSKPSRIRRGYRHLLQRILATRWAWWRSPAGSNH